MKTLIGIQQDYIDTVNSAFARWSHRPKSQYQSVGGHGGRIIRGAHRRLENELHKLGVTDKKQVAVIIKDAWDVAELERHAAE